MYRLVMKYQRVRWSKNVNQNDLSVWKMALFVKKRQGIESINLTENMRVFE